MKRSSKGGQTTRVVVINGSLRMEKGLTGKILIPFVEGMRQADARVDMLYVKPMDIQPCKGDFYCWETKPGECHIADDMQKMYRQLRAADVLVIATPVYVPLPGELQNVLNRLVPLLDPVLTMRNGRTRAKFRADVTSGPWRSSLHRGGGRQGTSEPWSESSGNLQRMQACTTRERFSGRTSIGLEKTMTKQRRSMPLPEPPDTSW